MPLNSCDLGLVAGEASGDLIASLVLAELVRRKPHLKMAGIAGHRMLEQGVEAWWPSDLLAVRGYVEVLRRYRALVKIRNRLKQHWIQTPPKLFMGVDAPDFNLNLEEALKTQGVPVVHLVCPSIWAWRPERIDQIRKSVDHVLCIFPFELDLLTQAHIPATYIGHPLAEMIPMESDPAQAKRLLGYDSSQRLVALLPGSRASEINYLLDIFLRSAHQILLESPSVRFVLPTLPKFKIFLQKKLENYHLDHAVQLLDGQSHLALAACDATLVASGTATLEAALFKKPMVIAYNMHPVSWYLTRRKKMQEWVGLPNILCRSFVVPEFLQDQAQPKFLAKAVLECLYDDDKIQNIKNQFSRLHLDLKRNSAALAADVLERFL